MSHQTAQQLTLGPNASSSSVEDLLVGRSSSGSDSGNDTAALDPVYITLAETARLSSLSIRTLYNWIQIGKLTRERGLRKMGNKCNIEWAVFKAAIDSGGFE